MAVHNALADALGEPRRLGDEIVADEHAREAANAGADRLLRPGARRVPIVTHTLTKEVIDKAIDRAIAAKSWKQITEARYSEMLEAVPPAFRYHGHFLYGEAVDYGVCALSEHGAKYPRYRPFVHDGKDYFEGEPMTRAEFQRFLEQPHREVKKQLRPCRKEPF